MSPLPILATGLVCAAGLNAPAACVAERCRLGHFRESRFLDRTGAWLPVAEVPDPGLGRGAERIANLAAATLAECLAGRGSPRHLLLVCPGPGDEPATSPWAPPGLPTAQVFAGGPCACLDALAAAVPLVERGETVALVAADSLLERELVEQRLARRALLAGDQGDGAILGEGAAALLLGPGRGLARITGQGRGREPEGRDAPRRAEGLSAAARAALAQAGCALADCGWMASAAPVVASHLRDAAVLRTRLLDPPVEALPLLTPAETWGDLGCAGPAALLVAAADRLGRQRPAGARSLLLVQDDGPERGALLLETA